MRTKPKRSLILCIVGSCTVLVIVLLTIVYRGWNARNRPALVAGTWYLDDLRTDEDENSLVTFSPAGAFDGDDDFGSRWRYADGRIFFRTWQLNDESKLARQVTNTTLYSFFADTDEFSLRADFSEDGSIVTLVAEDSGPRCRLRRAKP